MTTIHQRDSLEADLGQLKDLLAAPGAMSWITRMGLEARLAAATVALAEAVHPNTGRRAELELHFYGAPVADGHGIDAEFSTRAIGLIQRTISSVHASRLRGSEFRTTGKIPIRDQSALLVTGTVHGSFGFLLAQPEEPTGELFDTELAESTDVALRLVQEFARPDGDLEVLDYELSERVLVPIREFFKVLADARAQLVASDQNRKVSLDKEAVESGARRACDTSVQDSTVMMSGRFLMVPSSRRFELLGAAGETIAAGKINPTVSKLSLGSWLSCVNQTVEAQLVHRRITTATRKREVFLLLGLSGV